MESPVSRVRLAAANMATRLTLTMVTVLAGFISTPLLLLWIGKDALGAFTVAQGWLGLIGILELGFASAFSAVFASCLAVGDRERLLQVMAYSIRVYLGIALVMVLAGTLIYVWIAGLMKAAPGLTGDLGRGVLIGAVSISFIAATPFRVLLDAQQRGAFINLLLLMQAMVSMVAALAFAWLRWGIVGQFLALGVGSAMFAVAVTVECLRHYPEMRLNVLWAKPDAATRTSIWRISWKLSVNNLASRLGVLTDGLVIGKFLSATQFVPYTITRKLGDIYQGQLANIGNATWAALAELHAQDRRQLFNRRVVEITSLIGVASIAGLLPIAIYNKAFVSLWVGPSYYGGDLLSLAFLANAFLFCVWSFWAWVVTAVGKVDGLMSTNVAMLLINLPLTVGATWALAPHHPQLALCGPLLGNIAGFLAIGVWRMVLLLNRHFGIGVGTLHRALWSAPLLALPYLSLSWWLSRTFPPSNWMTLAISMALSAAGYAGLAWLVILDGEQKLLMRSVAAHAMVPLLRKMQARRA